MALPQVAGWLEHARELREWIDGPGAALPELERLNQVTERNVLLQLEHLRAHPAVAEAAVIAIPDDKWAERPLAAVVLKEGASVTSDELRAFLEPQFAKWWLPERWSFIDEVPKTSVGKFDKKVLRADYAEDRLTVLGN